MPILLALILLAQLPLPFTLFTGETQAKKPLPATMPGGIAIFDANNDGLLDIFFANGAPLPQARKTTAAHHNRLFLNRGDFQFQDATQAAKLQGTGYDFASAAADFDADGDIDLLVAGLNQIALYANDGKGVFTDITTQAGLNNHGRWSIAAAFFDYDLDQDLDLLIINYVQYDAAKEKSCVVDTKPDFCHPKHYATTSNALFRNDQGRFTDVSTATKLEAHPGKGMAVAIAPFFHPTLPDLFIPNDRVFNSFFAHQLNHTFEEQAFDKGIAAPSSGAPPSSMGSAVGDYNNDGYPDIIYTALRDETFPLYRNTGKEFIEVTEDTKLAPFTRPMAGWGVVWADLDNDGWLDLAIARGDVLSATGPRANSVKEPLTWLKNHSGKSFSKGADFPVPPAQYRGLLAADLNNDGCLDIVATALNAPARIIKGTCANNWLHVQGLPPGSTVRIDNQTRTTTTTSTSYASTCACPLHFGLGRQQTVDLEITYSDGRGKAYPKVPTNQYFRP